MPKHKTNKSVAKRVKVTARGKLLKHKPGSGHLKSRKSPKQIRKFRKTTEVPKQFAKQTRIMLGL